MRMAGRFSAVVLGAIDEVDYQLDFLGTPASLALYSVSSDCGSGESRLLLHDPGVRILSSAERVRRPESGSFEIRSGSFHSSPPADGGTVTVVATGLSGGQSFVVAPGNLGADIRNWRTAVKRLEGLLDALMGSMRLRAPTMGRFRILISLCGRVLMVRTTRQPDLPRSGAGTRWPMRTRGRRSFGNFGKKWAWNCLGSARTPLRPAEGRRARTRLLLGRPPPRDASVATAVKRGPRSKMVHDRGVGVPAGVPRD